MSHPRYHGRIGLAALAISLLTVPMPTTAQERVHVVGQVVPTDFLSQMTPPDWQFRVSARTDAAPLVAVTSLGDLFVIDVDRGLDGVKLLIQAQDYLLKEVSLPALDADYRVTNQILDRVFVAMSSSGGGGDPEVVPYISGGTYSDFGELLCEQARIAIEWDVQSQFLHNFRQYELGLSANPRFDAMLEDFKVQSEYTAIFTIGDAGAISELSPDARSDPDQLFQHLTDPTIDAGLRGHAAAELVGSGTWTELPPRYLELFRAAVGDPDDPIADAAYEGLLRFGTTDDRRRVYELLSSDWRTRSKVVGAVGRTLPPEAPRILGEVALDSSAAVGERVWAAQALRNLEAQDAVDRLEQLTRTGQNTAVRISAYGSLEEMSGRNVAAARALQGLRDRGETPTMDLGQYVNTFGIDEPGRFRAVPPSSSPRWPECAPGR